MSVTSYDPAVVHILLDAFHAHVRTHLSSARTYADHAQRPDIDMDDLRLAALTARRAAPPPSVSDILCVARMRNAMPWRAGDGGGDGGVRLPPVEARLEAMGGERRVEVPEFGGGDGPWVVREDERKRMEEKARAAENAASDEAQAEADAAKSAAQSAATQSAAVQNAAAHSVAVKNAAAQNAAAQNAAVQNAAAQSDAVQSAAMQSAAMRSALAQNASAAAAAGVALARGERG